MGKISTSPRYGIDITGTNLLSGGVGGGGEFGKIRKNEGIVTYERVIRS